MSERVEIIRQRLSDELQPSKLEISDDSHLHVGHEGAKGGAGHYSVYIVAAAFTGLNRIKRHQRVYQCVQDLMPHEIHALAIKAYSEDEVS